MTRTRNSKRLDSKTSNLTRRCNRKFNKAKTLKRLCKGSDWFGYDELTLIFFLAFSWTVGMKNRLDLIYEKLRCPDVSMRWWLSFSVGVDLDDPTTNVRDIAP